MVCANIISRIATVNESIRCCLEGIEVDTGFSKHAAYYRLARAFSLSIVVRPAEGGVLSGARRASRGATPITVELPACKPARYSRFSPSARVIGMSYLSSPRRMGSLAVALYPSEGRWLVVALLFPEVAASSSTPALEELCSDSFPKGSDPMP
eukprot:GHVU01092907.1.p1 GENE.GHVU01092907.1~~GHVU01092907.1.p1  ORF type:complete len:153 (-),score=7.09 GHVU01092907.1:98-556(-)